MKKKYYYDSPIQALYMMKEFGVNLKCENESSSYYYSFGKAMLDHIRREVLKDTTWEKNLGKIYVAPESEHIFEPKDGDLGQMKAEGARFFVKYNESLKEWKEWHCGGYYSDKNGSDIIMRNGKHFFNPKEEN